MIKLHLEKMMINNGKYCDRRKNIFITIRIIFVRELAENRIKNCSNHNFKWWNLISIQYFKFQVHWFRWKILIENPFSWCMILSKIFFFRLSIEFWTFLPNMKVYHHISCESELLNLNFVWISVKSLVHIINWPDNIFIILSWNWLDKKLNIFFIIFTR